MKKKRKNVLPSVASISVPPTLPATPIVIYFHHVTFFQRFLLDLIDISGDRHTGHHHISPTYEVYEGVYHLWV